MNQKYAILSLIILMAIMVSFKSPDRKEVTHKTQKSQSESRTDKFISHLKNGKPLVSFFAENWILIYHEDNRCSGSTDGQIDNLKSTQIDEKITLNVKNDGEGWACEKMPPKKYDFDFDVKKRVDIWDRFEIPDFKNEEKNTVYIAGAGESDYIKLYYNNENLIVKMKYSSEDPG